MQNGKSSDQLVGEIRMIRIDGVIVRDDRMRQLGDVQQMVDSMREVGLIEPIIVRRDTRELVSGLHRLEAARLLGREQILARLIDLNDMQAAMVEIDENLARVELTALERAEHIRRRKQIYEALHPETKHGGAPGKAGGGKDKSKGARAASFAADTAKKTGLSPRTIQEDAQIAKLSLDVKNVVKGTPLEKRKRELLALSRLPLEKQAPAARAVVSGEARTVAEAARRIGAPAGKRKVRASSAAIVARPTDHPIVITRTITPSSARCWSCGAPGRNPYDVASGYVGPSGEIVEVGYETAEMRQIKVVDRVIAGVDSVAKALAHAPVHDRARFSRDAAAILTEALRTLNGILSEVFSSPPPGASNVARRHQHAQEAP